MNELKERLELLQKEIWDSKENTNSAWDLGNYVYFSNLVKGIQNKLKEITNG